MDTAAFQGTKPMSKKTLYFGYYSAKQDQLSGHAVYVDEKGLQIKVTEAFSNPEHKKPTYYNDVVYVGELLDCIKSNIKLFDDNISTEKLLELCFERNREVEACGKQSVKTGKCYCCACKNINKAN